MATTLTVLLPLHICVPPITTCALVCRESARRRCQAASHSLALLFEKAGRARQLDARTGLHCFILFVPDRRHVAQHADETFGSGRNVRNSASSGSFG